MADQLLILRPDAVVLPGSVLASGLEVCVGEGRIEEVRPWSAAARDEAGLVLSPAFVNAHSHLEYFDFVGRLDGLAYWPWIRELTRLKPARRIQDVRQAALEAARHNVRTGVAALGEVSDWPVSGQAMHATGMSGRIFQEIITFNERPDPEAKLEAVRQNAERNAADSSLPVHLSAHSAYTVSPAVLQDLGAKREPNSIHVSETPFESEFFERGEGPIAEMYKEVAVDFEPPGLTALSYLDRLGCLHEKTQVVHACALTPEDIELAAARGVTVAHCPRSNAALGCPPAAVAQLRRRGLKVGLGLDSAASSGPIDMFAEMRWALETARARGEPLTAQDVWEIATTEAAESIWLNRDWRIAEGANPDLMLLQPSGRADLGGIISGQPEQVIRLIRVNFPG